jgi:hypothetical protein
MRTLLLVAAIVLFVLSVFVTAGWMVPVGLAAFAGAHLVGDDALF